MIMQLDELKFYFASLSTFKPNEAIQKEMVILGLATSNKSAQGKIRRYCPRYTDFKGLDLLEYKNDGHGVFFKGKI